MYKREIELSGHIIDSLTLPKTMDIIMDNGGDFDILEFDIGKRKSDTSKAKIMVSAESPDILNSILDELNFIGVSISEIEDSIFYGFSSHFKNRVLSILETRINADMISEYINNYPSTVRVLNYKNEAVLKEFEEKVFENGNRFVKNIVTD